ncbi:MAG: SEC-C domain-containing protein, partial [Chromatiales bacterium]|nr:SEC-C domain-containing protein [Chromatiales bacterium]
GRGTDIVLGGSLEAEWRDNPADKHDEIRAAWEQRHKKVLEAGGLHIIGTERHESRRIDNQLRGRSGRQGDPGSSRFYLSLQDNLMRIFASERVAGLMQKLGMERGEAIEHPWVTKAIENAQRKVEGRNFDIRKQLLKYDDVANDQRKVIYEQRSELMSTEDISDTIRNVRTDIVNGIIDAYIPPQSLEEQWDLAGLTDALEKEFGVSLDIAAWLEADERLHEEPLRERIVENIEAAQKIKEDQIGADAMRHLEKAVMLQVLDSQWKEHLAAMDYLRQGIHLRGYAQKNPEQEYKRESFEMFSSMLENIKHDVVTLLARIQVRDPSEVDAMDEQQQRQSRSEWNFQHAPADVMGGEQTPEEPAEADHAPFVREGRKIGRNEPCPCGSGKKYKHCHGKLA